MKDLYVDMIDVDISISSGDLEIKNSTYQNQSFLLLARKGEIRPHPRVGVGIDDYLNGEKAGGVSSVIKQEFERDGMTVNSVEVLDDDRVEIDASYNKQ